MQRVIFLVDMNAFFISCEAIRHPEIIGLPAAVAGDPEKRSGIILTANYEARKFGIKTTMLLHEALKRCPDMLLFPPDHTFYEKKSKEVMNILSQYSPIIEQNSIDEAWLDMTGCEGIFGKPLGAAEKIMKQINDELGLCCSIGISENKFLSKMASEIKKPLGITELWRRDVENKLWPLSTQSMYGVGKQTTEKLKNMGVETIGDLAHFSSEYLIRRLGKVGAEIKELANGIDFSPVKPRCQDEMKSISRSVTLSKDICDIEYAKTILMTLSDEVGTSARRHEKKGHTVQINIKYANFKTISRQLTISPTYLVKDIYSAAIELLKKNWNYELPIRLLGISLSGFSKDPEAKQISMFDLMETDCKNLKSAKEDKLESTIDAIRQKYGTSIISRAALLNRKDKF